MDDVLAAAADSDRVVVFPAPATAHETPALEQAGHAARGGGRGGDEDATARAGRGREPSSRRRGMSMGNIVEPGDGTGAVRAACREAMEAAGLSIAPCCRPRGAPAPVPRACSSPPASGSARMVACGLPWLCGEARGAVTAVRAMLAAFLAGLAIVALEWEPGALTGVAYDRISILHLTFLALLTGFWTLVRRFPPKTPLTRLLLAIAGAALCLGVLRGLYPDLFESPLAGVPRDALPYIHMVNEYRPVRGLANALILFGTFVFAVPWLLTRLWRARGETTRWGWTALALCLLFYPLFALAWQRWAPYGGIFLAIAPAGLAVDVDRGIDGRLAGLRRVPVKVAALLALLVGPMVLGLALRAAAPAPSVGGEQVARPACDLAPLVAYLRHPEWRDRPHTLLASANFEPELLYRTQHQVVAMHYHPLIGGLYDSLKFLKAGDEARAIARRRAVDLIVICPGSGHLDYALWHGRGMYDRLRGDDPPSWIALSAGSVISRSIAPCLERRQAQCAKTAAATASGASISAKWPTPARRCTLADGPMASAKVST